MIIRSIKKVRPVLTNPSSPNPRLAKPRRKIGLGPRFLRDKSGSSAVEFAILIGPFLALMFSTFEIGWYYFANSRMDTVTLDAARLIRTGDVQGINMTSEQFFREVVCPELDNFGKCEERLTVEVETFPTFTALQNDNSQVVCRNDAEELVEAIKYDTGTENSIVRVRLCLLFKTLNPAIGVNLTDEQGFKKLTTSFTFRSEPFLRNQQTTTGG
ncbi:MAG: TadE/TadG family type IV pilus assembly protein [Pseudomonadota bacterium]